MIQVRVNSFARKFHGFLPLVTNQGSFTAGLSSPANGDDYAACDRQDKQHGQDVLHISISSGRLKSSSLYSTVTDFARFRGLSTSVPRANAT